jgi:hypothetical protein
MHAGVDTNSMATDGGTDGAWQRSLRHSFPVDDTLLQAGLPNPPSSTRITGGVDVSHFLQSLPTFDDEVADMERFVASAVRPAEAPASAPGDWRDHVNVLIAEADSACRAGGAAAQVVAASTQAMTSAAARYEALLAADAATNVPDQSPGPQMDVHIQRVAEAAQDIWRASDEEGSDDDDDDEHELQDAVRPLDHDNHAPEGFLDYSHAHFPLTQSLPRAIFPAALFNGPEAEPAPRPGTSHGRGRTPSFDAPPMVAEDEYDEELREIANYEKHNGYIQGTAIPPAQQPAGGPSSHDASAAHVTGTQRLEQLDAQVRYQHSYNNHHMFCVGSV